MAENAQSFEASMSRLDEIVKLLEHGDVSLEDSLVLFEEGTAIIKRCEGILSTAEQKVEKLIVGQEQVANGSSADDDDVPF